MTVLTHIFTLTSFLTIWTLSLKSMIKDYCHFSNSNILMLKAISHKTTNPNQPSFYAFQWLQKCPGVITTQQNRHDYKSLLYDSIHLNEKLEGEI